MRVLLVYANRSRDFLPPPPIGLAYVAGATRRAGHEVAAVDLLPSRDPAGLLKGALRRCRPEVVGVSVRSIDNVVPQRWVGHLGGVAETLSLIRRESDAVVVLGGPAISILREGTLRALDADFAVVGEGEETLPRLLAEMKGGRRFAGVPGLVWRDGGGTVVNRHERLATFSASGLEEWVTWRRYERLGGTWPMQSKRGCTLACSYCVYPTIEGDRHRLRPAEEVVDEIERVSRVVGPRTFEIVDSTFNVPLDHALALCEEIVRRGLKVNLSATTVNPIQVSRELFTLMRRAGFIAIMVTPDSASDATLAGLGKGFGKEAVARTAELVAESGIDSGWFFLLGGPGETEATAEETVSFIEGKLGGPRVLSVVTTGVRILPGSPLELVQRSQGRIAPGHDFTRPAHYFSPDVSERWLLERVNRAIRSHPNIVHSAEENANVLARAYYGALRRLGHAPPYWRFLPRLLATPPLRAVRGRATTF